MTCTNNEGKQKVFLFEPATLKLFPLWQGRCKGWRSHHYPINPPRVIAGIMWLFQLGHQRRRWGTMHGHQGHIRSRCGSGKDLRVTSRGSDEWGVWGFPGARPAPRTRWKHVSPARNCRVWAASTWAKYVCSSRWSSRLECVISACKWRVKPSAGKHDTKPSNTVSGLRRNKGGAGFSNKRSQIPPQPQPSDFADAMETSKKTGNKEKETGSVLFSPQPATRWFGCRPWKMKEKCTVGGEGRRLVSRQPDLISRHLVHRWRNWGRWL